MFGSNFNNTELSIKDKSAVNFKTSAAVIVIVSLSNFVKR